MAEKKPCFAAHLVYRHYFATFYYAIQVFAKFQGKRAAEFPSLTPLAPLTCRVFRQVLYCVTGTLYLSFICKKNLIKFSTCNSFSTLCISIRLDNTKHISVWFCYSPKHVKDLRLFQRGCFKTYNQELTCLPRTQEDTNLCMI